MIKALFKKQTTILSAAGVLMFLGLASRILGLLRDRVLAHFFTPQNLDIYFASARIPSLIFDLVITGAISTAFIPVFSEYLSRGKKEEGFTVASTLLSLSLVFFLVLAGVYFVFAEKISTLIAPGFTFDQIFLMSKLTRIMLGAQVFFILASFLTGVAQSFQRFIIPAISLTLYNVGIIWGTALLAPKFGLYGPAMGMVVGAFLYLLVQLPLLKNVGFRPSWNLDYRNSGVRRVIKLMAPRMLALFANQIEATVDVALASLSSLGALTYFSFSQHLQFFPVSLFGLTIAQAALPTLSLEAGIKDLKAFKKTFLTSFHQMFFLIIPASVTLLVLRVPLVRLAFGATRFDWEATVMTGYVIAGFAVGIFAQGAAYFLARGFYALQDTKTPVLIQIFSVAVSVSLCLLSVLVFHLPVWSLALSYSSATLLHAGLLLIFLYRKVGGFDLYQLIVPFVKISSSSVVSGFSMYFFLKVLDRSAWDQRLSFLGGLTLPAHFEVFVIDTRYTLNLVFLTTFVILVGALVYFVVSWLLRVEEITLFTKLLRKLKLPFPRD